MTNKNHKPIEILPEVAEGEELNAERFLVDYPEYRDFMKLCGIGERIVVSQKIEACCERLGSRFSVTPEFVGKAQLSHLIGQPFNGVLYCERTIDGRLKKRLIVERHQEFTDQCLATVLIHEYGHYVDLVTAEKSRGKRKDKSSINLKKPRGTSFDVVLRHLETTNGFAINDDMRWVANEIVANLNGLWVSKIAGFPYQLTAVNLVGHSVDSRLMKKFVLDNQRELGQVINERTFFEANGGDHIYCSEGSLCQALDDMTSKLVGNLTE